MALAKQISFDTVNGRNVCTEAVTKRGKVQSSPINSSALVSDVRKTFVEIFRSLMFALRAGDTVSFRQ